MLFSGGTADEPPRPSGLPWDLLYAQTMWWGFVYSSLSPSPTATSPAPAFGDSYLQATRCLVEKHGVNSVIVGSKETHVHH